MDDNVVTRRTRANRGRLIWQGAVAAIAVSGMALFAAPQASAATHNVMIVGASIPSGAKSAMVYSSSGSVCINDLSPGQDRSTGVSVSDGGLLVYTIFRANGCGNGDIIHSRGVDVPENLSTTNYWLRLDS
jgi:hypothetical protein